MSSISLRRAADRAADRGDFLAFDLDAYRRALSVPEATLANALGITVESLPVLQLCGTPRREAFVADTSAIAAYVGASMGELARIIRVADGLRSLQRTPVDHQRVLMSAARDRVQERTRFALADVASSEPQWLVDVAESFWSELEPSDAPRDLELAILWSQPLGIVDIPGLTVSGAREFLSSLRIPWTIDHVDRALRSCLLVFGGAGLILVDASDDPAERRLSLAHEVAHYLRDYSVPRAEIERRTPHLVEIIDGLREPTTDDEVSALLAHVDLRLFTDLFDREPAGGYASALQDAREVQAMRLSWQLLAPADEVLSRAAAASASTLPEVLVQEFGFPSGAASDYAHYLRRRIPESFDVRRRLGLDETS